MKHIIILSFLLFSCLACSNNRKSSSNTAAVNEPPTGSVCNAESERDTVRHYRFLDFRHDGSKESFLREARKSNVFFPLDSSHVVRFLDADWELKIHTDTLGNVTEVNLFTSNTSREIFKRASTELPTFFGEPWLLDTEELMIRWSSFYCNVFFRHLNTNEGGWIIVFNLNDTKPTPAQEHLLEEYKDAIRKFQEDVKSKDREKIASHFKYPFDLGYPLPEIKDVDDFLSRYELIFDNVIEEEIIYSNAWSYWNGITCNSGHLLFGKVDNDNLIITSFSTHPAAYYKAMKEEINIQRQRVHPSLRNYQRPIVVAKAESCIFRVDEIIPGELRLSFWKKGKTMKDAPDYVNQKGFISQVGSSGTPDWLFVNGKDTVWVGFMSFGNSADYYALKRFSGEKTFMDIEFTDFED